MTIPLYIPYFSRPDLLNAAWDSIYENDQINPIVIDNSPSGASSDDRIVYGARQAMVRLSVPLHFGPSTHWMHAEVKRSGAPYWLVMHADAEDTARILPDFVAFADRLEQAGERWGWLLSHYDALAAYNVVAYEAIGGWDNHLPSYYGDNDWRQRTTLSGYPTIDTNLHVVHHASSVIKSDPRQHFLSDQRVRGWHDYYVAKHGNVPGQECYDSPFNRPDLFSDWKCCQ